MEIHVPFLASKPSLMTVSDLHGCFSRNRTDLESCVICAPLAKYWLTLSADTQSTCRPICLPTLGFPNDISAKSWLISRPTCQPRDWLMVLVSMLTDSRATYRLIRHQHSGDTSLLLSRWYIFCLLKFLLWHCPCSNFQGALVAFTSLDYKCESIISSVRNFVFGKK